MILIPGSSLIARVAQALNLSYQVNSVSSIGNSSSPPSPPLAPSLLPSLPPLALSRSSVRSFACSLNAARQNHTTNSTTAVGLAQNKTKHKRQNYNYNHKTQKLGKLEKTKKKMERRWVEVLFLAALAAMTAVLHYARGSPPPSAYLLSGRRTEHSASFNYACLLAVTATAYLASRAATAAVSSAIPASVKASVSARRAALVVLYGPVAAFTLHAAAGRPELARHAAIQWMALNLERNGQKDAAWCARLFVLLVCWQAALAAAALACRTVARGLASLHPVGGGASGSGRVGGGRGDDVAAAAAAASAAAFAAAAAASAAAEKLLLAGDAVGEGFDESAGEKDLDSGESGGEGEADGKARSGMMAPALG